MVGDREQGALVGELSDIDLVADAYVDFVVGLDELDPLGISSVTRCTLTSTSTSSPSRTVVPPAAGGAAPAFMASAPNEFEPNMGVYIRPSC